MAIKLSAAIATYNEEENISDCLKSVKEIVDEIIIIDGSSTDRTVEIAKQFGAKIKVVDNPPIFHINKQKAFDLASGDWVLYLDADERISEELGAEILRVINMKDEEIKDYQVGIKNRELFLRHQTLIEERDGKIGTNGKYVAFFFPRLNFFLGKFLRYGGVYPDGVIRLFKKNKAYLPCKSVHEQMVVLGRVGWLQNNLIHMDSKTFSRYFKRNTRYIDLYVEELNTNNLKINLFTFLQFMLVKPVNWFFTTYIIHKGILDGFQGFTFSLYSSLRFPRAYWRYMRNENRD